MRSITMSAAAAVAALVTSLTVSPPAHADTVNLPFGGTATLIIPDVVLPSTGNGINHYGSLSVTHLYDWDVSLTANGPSTWPASDFIYGDGPQNRIVDLQLCPSFDQPGLYTVSGLFNVYDYDYDSSEVLLSDQFTISRPAPPVVATPPVVTTPPPATTTVPVRGTVKHSAVRNGVRITLRTKPTPAGATTGKVITWKVKADGRTVRTVRQGPAEVSTVRVTFARPGRHVVQVFNNGKRVKSITVRG